MKDLLRELYFGLIAVLMISEFFASNLYTITFDIESVAELMRVSIPVSYRHMSTLAVLDLVAGTGAVMVLWRVRHAEAVRLGRNGVILATLGLLAYGGYQLWHTTNQLNAHQDTITIVGTAYALLGVGAWFVAGDFKSVTNSTQHGAHRTKQPPVTRLAATRSHR